MTEKIYVFWDEASGTSAVFTSRDALKKFMKEYVAEFYEENDCTPDNGGEYILRTTILNPTLEQFNNFADEEYR